nr:general stress protein [Sciscionella marina]
MVVTGPFQGQGQQPRNMPRLPTPPTGWPIGSYETYEEAQRAVDYLADSEFAVQDVTIVGVDLMSVERVVARLTWGKILANGALSGAWFGLFVGLLLSFFISRGNPLWPILLGLGFGLVFGIGFAAVAYGSSRGNRDFASTSQLVAGRYDVLCEPRNAEKGRELLAKLQLRGPNTNPGGSAL